MELVKNSLRSFLSKKVQSVLLLLLVTIGVCTYTIFTEHGDVMYYSVTTYDAAQNTENYGFIPYINLTEAQWEDIFTRYHISESDQLRFKNKELDGITLIETYNVNLYEYQAEFIADVESTYDLTVEPSFNKMVTNGNGHEYRVFTDYGTINMPYLLEGVMPADKNELTVSPEYAKYNNLSVGDSLDINGIIYTISGFAWHPANSYPIVISNVINESSVYYPETQSVMFMTEDGLNALDGKPNFAYKSTTNQELTVGEKNIKYHALYDSNDFEILDNALDTISHGEAFLRINGSSVLSAILVTALAVICLFMVMQIIKRRVDADKKQLGVLKALGYGNMGIAMSYCPFPIIISLFGSGIGYAIAQPLYKMLIDVMYKDYNVPVYYSFANYTTLLLVIIVPLVCLVAASFITALFYLRKEPLDLIGDNANSKVNALGRFTAKTLRKASFVIRVKFQTACRSISKLTAMTVIGFCASVLLISGLIFNSAFSGIVDKTFQAMLANSIVIYKENKNIAEEPLLYEDEEVSLGKDFFIQEIIYPNGNNQVFDDSNKVSTETIGVSPDSRYINLTNEKGERLNGLLPTGVVINHVVEGRFGLKVGDRLLLRSTHAGIDAEFEIVGISDEYSGYILYADMENLTEIFEYSEGTYNAAFTNHKYSLSDNSISKIISAVDIRAGLGGNISMFQNMSLLMMVIAALIALIIIMMMANLLIEENSKSISTFKVLGYSSREISNLVVNTYTPLLVIGYVAGLPISLALMNLLKTFMEEKFEVPMMVSLNTGTAVLGFVILMAIYYVGLFISRRNIDKIVLAEALKCNE